MTGYIPCMRLPDPIPCLLKFLPMPLLPLLLLAGCKGQAASDFWEAMGMLFMGLMVLAAIAMILQLIVMLFMVLMLMAELAVFIMNFYRPTRNTVVAGAVFGALHVFSGVSGAALGVAMMFEQRAQEEAYPATEWAQDGAEMGSASSQDTVLMGLLGCAVSLGLAGAMFGSSVYGNARLKESAPLDR